MPIYEYRCASCGHQQEFLQKVSAAPPTVCPKCQQPALTKMVTAAGFQLKGSGWYATDFKGKGAAPAKADAAAAPKADAAKPDAAKTDTAKPEAAKPAEKKGGDAKSDAAAS
jgi:putative FmdB family regulatory protein